MWPGRFSRAGLLALGVTAGKIDGTPRAVVTHALRAVEGDSVAAVADRWRRAVAQDPPNRLAALGLATVARLTYRYDVADSAFAALVEPVDTSPRRRADAKVVESEAISIYALLGWAWAFDARGFVGRADTTFVRAGQLARAIGDHGAASEALIGLSVNRASQRGIPVGLALLDTAARLAPAAAADLRADIAVRRALFATILSRPSAARDATAAAVQAHEAGEPRLEARALRALALGLELANRLDSAATVLTAVERIERTVHDQATLAETLLRHGDVFHNRGEIGPYKQYALAGQREGHASHNFYALGASNIALGSVALLLNDLVSADRYLARAAAQYDTMQDQSGFALVRTYQADLAVAVGDWSRAQALAEQARDFDHGIGDPAEFEEWRDLIEIAIRAGNLDAAARSLSSAESLARRRHQPEWNASLDVDRARLALAQKRPPEAIAALGRYLTSLDTAEHSGRYTARTLLALADARLGYLDRAERELTVATDELDAWRATIDDSALRPYIFQAGGTEVNDRDAAMATVLAALAVGGHAPAAFALAERRRARDLADRLVRLGALRVENVPVTPGFSPATLPASGRAARPAAQGDWHAVADSVAALLPDSSTAVLEFVTGAYGAPTTAFLVTPSVERGPAGRRPAVLWAYTVPSADSLARPIARFLALLESGDDAPQVGASIAASTVDSALELAGPRITHLIIVPDGPLHRLPFDAIRLRDGRPLATRYVVSIAPSAGVLLALWQRAGPGTARRDGVRLLALGDPAFVSRRETPDGEVGLDTYRDAFDSVGGLPRLAQSAREARLVARYAASADVRLRSDASAAFLLRAPLRGYDVIHVATHALVDERSVERTALVLAPGGGESGFVTPSQLAALDLDADLVVLSACRTAGGVVIDGDGVQGLTGPFLAAGARTVVASQWRIGDRATVPMVAAFYDALARGLTVADALHTTKVDAIARGASAAEWAAFTVVGDPFVRIALRRPHDTAWVALAVIAALGVLTAAVLAWRRRSA